MTVLRNRVVQGSAADLVYVYRDDDGLPLDFDSSPAPTSTVVDPRGTIVSSVDATMEYAGHYTHRLQTTSSSILGWYSGTLTGYVRGNTEKITVQFELVRFV